MKEKTEEFNMAHAVAILGFALYLGLQSIQYNITIEPSILSQEPKQEQDNITISKDNLDAICEPYQDWGYNNGLIISGRALGEAEFFKEQGWDYRTCEEISDNLYDLGKEGAVQEPYTK